MPLSRPIPLPPSAAPSAPSAKSVGISQVQLAENTGFMQSWMSNLEHGRRNPTWANVVRLADGLGVGVAQLAKAAEDAAQT